MDSVRDEDAVFINKVGTFGVGSAAFWWSRMAAVAAQVWFGIAASAWDTYLLTYVDDCWATALGPHFALHLLAWVLLGRALSSHFGSQDPRRD